MKKRTKGRQKVMTSKDKSNINRYYSDAVDSLVSYSLPELQAIYQQGGLSNTAEQAIIRVVQIKTAQMRGL